MKESGVFGLTIFVDSFTTLSTLFIRKLEVGVRNKVGLLDIADCTGCVSKGIKKDAKCISKLFIPHIERLDKK